MTRHTRATKPAEHVAAKRPRAAEMKKDEQAAIVGALRLMLSRAEGGERPPAYAKKAAERYAAAEASRIGKLALHGATVDAINAGAPRDFDAQRSSAFHTVADIANVSAATVRDAFYATQPKKPSKK